MPKTPFRFDGAVDESSVALATIPSGVTTKTQLLETLSAGLSFPGYFGHNWDALDELIHTLEWLPQGRVTIVHEELPRLDAKSLAIYLRILKRGAERWRSTSSHELLVVFPERDRFQIEAILSDEPA